ncbi:MAG: 2-succinyl-6-hydroxy-2,4-cyclohexadiene-1-carboxylate synthase [Balneolaceae bacterium]|nr:2-succinyl-6-hydroxy-2,4-cyclohexadiene-1-carboxylate synthase [Balneolaceae bacterium]
MLLYSDSFYYHCTVHQSEPELPYLLMLHGFMGSEKVFEHFIRELNSFCNPITIDLAGHGETESPADSTFYSAERQVQQLHSIIRRLQVDNLYLYGYSMGGRLAFQMIASHPDLFSGVMIESSHCGIASEKARINRQKLDEKRAQRIEQNYDDFIENWMDLPLFKHTPNPMKSVYKKIMEAQNPKTLSASLRGFGAGIMPPVCDKLNETDLPITLIAGEHDEKYVERMSEIHQQTDRSRLKIIKNAGHRVHADQPEELTLILKNSLKV